MERVNKVNNESLIKLRNQGVKIERTKSRNDVFQSVFGGRSPFGSYKGETMLKPAGKNGAVTGQI